MRSCLGQRPCGQMVSLMPRAMLLLRGIAIRNPDLRHTAAHRLFHDTGGARIVGLMHHRILAVKHPMIGVGPLNPHAVPCRRPATQTRRIGRNELVCGRGTHRDCRPADDCAAHVQASPRQDGSSRVSLSCQSREASTNCATSYPVVEAGSPAQSTRPCSGAANQCDPCAHGFGDRSP